MHTWHPIEDLPDGHVRLASGQLATLRAAWQSRRRELEGSAALERFVQRMVRQWSIQTGLIERLYTLDAGVTLTLVEQGFDAAYVPHGATNMPADHLIRVLSDHREAAEGLFAFVKNARSLSTSYVKELHAAICRSQESSDAVDSLGRTVQVELVRGAYKTQPNNPRDRDTRQVVFEYCPPEHVDAEMERLVAMHLAHGDVSSEVEAAWLHHRFTQIHPFQDGNGRVARALATLVCLRDGGFPLVVMNEEKPGYIDALRAADRGDLHPLVELTTRLQVAAYQQALSLSRDVIDDAVGMDALLADARRRIETRSREVLPVHAHAEHLHRRVQEKWQEIARQIDASMSDLNAGIKARVLVLEPSPMSTLAVPEISSVAARFGYRPDLAAESWCAQLVIDHPTHVASYSNQTGLIVSLHHVGDRAQGLMAATAFLRPSGGPAGAESEALCDLPFFWTEQSMDQAGFEVWLDGVARRGIARWRQLL